MATRKPKAKPQAKQQPKQYPVVTVGSHLTVTEHEDGRTELVWDDEALLNDVRAATTCPFCEESYGTMCGSPHCFMLKGCGDE